MTGDYTRSRSTPSRTTRACSLQQGRVSSTPTSTSWSTSLDRRLRAETIDIIGAVRRCPIETPERVPHRRRRRRADDRPGRALRRRPAGREPRRRRRSRSTRVLGEQRGTRADPLRRAALPARRRDAGAAARAAAPHLVYLDVWQREVTWLEDADLVETGGRRRHVDAPADRVAGPRPAKAARATRARRRTTAGVRRPRRAPSAGRLTTGAVGVAARAPIRASITPAGGYRGLENRLYRVEIHDAGPAGHRHVQVVARQRLDRHRRDRDRRRPRRC